MGPKSRWARRAATRSRRSPTPATEEEVKEQVTEEVQDDSNVQTPQSQARAEDNDEDENQEEVDEDEDGEEPVANADEETDEAAAHSEQGEDASNPTPPHTSQPRGRRGRGGRRGRPFMRQSGRSASEVGPDEGSDAGTPARRGRGRGRGGNWRGFRGRGRGANRGPSHATRVPIDKAGNMMDVIDDEVVIPEDPEGETKVDKSGNLLGGREYRVRTFTIAGRESRLYMLSTEPARCTGFRDSYLFFNKHLALFKIILDDYEKRDLIERDVIPHSYKGRAIGVVTARSVFREFGCKIVVGGKKVTDDYQTQKARDRGDMEGQLVDPDDRIPEAGQEYNRNQYVAWHGASSVYHNQGPNIPMPGGKPLLAGKRKTNITTTNWKYEHAKSASDYSARINASRKTTLDGVYDPHTNLMCYPAIMQPTHARWEHVDTPPGSPLQKHAIADGASSGKLIIQNGTGDHIATTKPSWSLPKATISIRNHTTLPNRSAPSEYLKRNYLITDMHLSTPPDSSFTLLNIPPSLNGPRSMSNPDYSAGRPPHLGIPTITEEEMEQAGLPDECRQALRNARRDNAEWASQWKGTEAEDGARGELKLGIGLPREA